MFPVGTRHVILHRQAGGAVWPDDKGELGDELRQVQADLQVAGCCVAIARVGRHGLVFHSPATAACSRGNSAAAAEP